MASITTATAGTVINGGAFTVPNALGDKVINPYSDFLLHDIGTGDGIPILPARLAHVDDHVRALDLILTAGIPGGKHI